MKAFLSLSLTLAMLASCGRQPESTPSVVDLVAGNYGHQELLNTTAGKNFFLVDWNPRKGPYKVCFDANLLNNRLRKTPILDKELIAAIKIWGHYIGRDIEVEMTKISLSKETETEGQHAYLSRIHKECPLDTQLVVGEFSNMTSPMVHGMTTLTFGNLVVPETRAIFFRRPTFQQGGSSRWFDSSTIAQPSPFVKVSDSVEKILELLKSRQGLVYRAGEGEVNYTLSMLLQATGKMWGLCQENDASTPCDPRRFTGFQPGSAMSTMQWISKAYLSDDDIAGIQAFLSRPEYHHAGFPTSVNNRLLIKPERVVTSELAYFKVIGAFHFSNNEIIATLGYDVKSRTKLVFEFYNERTGRWDYISNPIYLEAGESYPSERFKFPANSATSRYTKGMLTITTASRYTAVREFDFLRLMPVNPDHFYFMLN